MKEHAEHSLAAIQAALRTTTEALAIEVAEPGSPAPHWSPFEWCVARAVASMHGVSPLLSSRSEWRGADGWQEFLAQQRAHTERRFLRMRTLLQQIDGGARAAGIALLPLKGAALHALGIYNAGERPMADLDILIRESDIDSTHRLLSRLGFRVRFDCARHRVFEPDDANQPSDFGEHSDNPIKLELHTGVGENLPLRRIDITPDLHPTQAHAGLNTYRSKGALMSHLLLHAAGCMAFRAVRLINLHDIALLSAHMAEEDWFEVLEGTGARRQPAWWVFPPLALTNRYYGSTRGASSAAQPIPAPVLTAAAGHCHRALRITTHRRCLADVSLSHLWITALPGLHWCGSIAEACTYVARRIAPSKAIRALRPHVAVSQPKLPDASVETANGTWIQLSQTRRILRWLTSRPYRPESLGPVTGALARWH